MAGIKDTASTQHSALSRRKTKTSKTRTPRTASRKTKARARKPAAFLIPSSPIEFPEFKGKTIADLKLYLHLDDTGISVDFTDKTHANFSLEPRLTVRTALADISTGNWRDIKNWPVMITESGHLDDWRSVCTDFFDWKTYNPARHQALAADAQLFELDSGLKPDRVIAVVARQSD